LKYCPSNVRRRRRKSKIASVFKRFPYLRTTQPSLGFGGAAFLSGIFYKSG
jgi:hypothetical protein